MAEQKSQPLLRNVSDTALWVAAYRAEESERPDALFHDPHARRLAGSHGFELLDAMPNGRKYGWPMVVRTVVFDRLILERIAQGADVVLNLAAGLDARPYRMPLPAGLQWIEADLPPMIEYKTGLLSKETPVCTLERVSIDLSDAAARRAFFGAVGARGKNVLVLTEGLLIYLQPEQVGALADDLAAVPSIRSWATDLSSPGLLKMMMRTWGKRVASAGAPFLFAPAEGPAYFTAHGWRVVATQSSFREAARLQRLKFPLSLFARFPDPKTWKPKRIWGGMVLLERA